MSNRVLVEKNGRCNKHWWAVEYLIEQFVRWVTHSVKDIRESRILYMHVVNDLLFYHALSEFAHSFPHKLLCCSENYIQTNFTACLFHWNEHVWLNKYNLMVTENIYILKINYFLFCNTQPKYNLSVGHGRALRYFLCCIYDSASSSDGSKHHLYYYAEFSPHSVKALFRFCEILSGVSSSPNFFLIESIFKFSKPLTLLTHAFIWRISNCQMRQQL